MAQVAATAYLAAIAGVIAFQICLLAGAPWGHLTQGGQHDGPLPASGRMAAGVSILVLLFMAAGVSSAAGLRPDWPLWTGWTAFGVQALSTLANWATRSRPERRLWGPITSVMLVLAGIVVFAAR